MAGSVTEEYGRSSDGTLGEQRCMSGEVLAEWRSCEQVENGTPSTSPPFWDTDDDDNDYECGTKPSDLYGKFTWKIENFSQISKRELRSNAFEVGGYKWYILIYPQGCDVCNHLSLFLCVANHDKLLPGWSHFAQFTIAVVNKDPKKSKYSDTLHRFWKKEHDWGWKKFMELSKVSDGFISSDTLVIKAQVQVIREKVDRPFRCLDCQYRRELVRVYLTNVEQICRRFVEERRGKLVKLIEDKARWSSFCAFWSEIDQGARRRMSREKTDVILRVVVKHFFIEKEVTSTLVMDSLHSGLRALEWQSKCKNERAKLLDIEEPPAPIMRMENDMFVLADDVVVLLQRASLEPLPPKDEKGPQNRTKDGSSGEDFNKDSIERDEMRLTELGRRTVEIFVLAHIFSNRIEVAHQEAVALKKQEELIREEEAAGQAESEQKSKRGAANKDKRAKKKQGKNRRTRKVKDKGKDEKSHVSVQDKEQGTTPSDIATVVDSAKLAQSLPEKPGTPDDASNVTDSGDDISEMLQQETEERNASTVNWDTDPSEAHPIIETNCGGISSIPVPNERVEKKSTSVMDDSSSTCSTDSVLSVALNGNHTTNSLPNGKIQKSPSRGKKHRGKEKRDQTVSVNDTENQSAELLTGQGNQYDTSQSCTVTGSESEPVVSSKDGVEHRLHEKQEVVALQKKPNVKDQVDVDRLSKQMMAAEALSSLSSPTKNSRSIVQRKPSVEDAVRAQPILPSERSLNSLQKTEKTISSRIASIQTPATLKPNVQNAAAASRTLSKTEKPTSHQVPAMSRPSSAPIIPAPRPSTPVASMVQTAPSLARSLSAAGRLGPDPSPATHSYAPPSYRNAIMGKTTGANSSGFSHCPPSSVNPSPVCSQPLTLVSSPMLSAQSSVSKEQRLSSSLLSPQSPSGFTFGSMTQEVLQNRPLHNGESSRSGPSSIDTELSLLNDMRNLDLCNNGSRRSRMYSEDPLPGSVSAPRQAQGMAEEFPHLDIINYLLDEENSMGRTTMSNAVFSIPNNGHHHQLSRQYTFPGDMAMSAEMSPSINCCRFDRPTSHHDEGVLWMRGSSNADLNGMGYAVHQVGNGQIDGAMQNQWPGSASHFSLPRMRNAEGDVYSYQMPQYSNQSCGVNNYTIFEPSSGH